MKVQLSQMSAEDILKQFTNKWNAARIASFVEILLIIAGACLYFMGKLSFGLTILFYIFILIVHFVIRVNQQSSMMKMNTILQVECNPRKYVYIFEGIQKLSKRKRPMVSLQLSIARGYYLMGDFQKASEILNEIEFKKNVPFFLLQYYNTLANCCNEIGDCQRLEECRKKVVTLQSLQKSGSGGYDQAQRVIDIIDGLLAIKDGEYEDARVIQENLLEGANVPLQRATICYHLGGICEAQKQWDKAIEYYQTVIENGGSIYCVEKAKSRVKELKENNC